LAWEPAVPIRDGLIRTIDWFRRHHDFLDVTGPVATADGERFRSSSSGLRAS